MIDTHSHILPGVDDGARTLQQSIEMIKMAHKNGVQSMFATPHYIQYEGYNEVKDNTKIFKWLESALKEENIDIDIYMGHEIFITPDIVTLIEEEKVATLNGSRYVLIELPMFDVPKFTEDIIYALRIKGYVPIIAHPERNKKIIDDPNILYHLIHLGALTQLNLSSIGGYYGQDVKNTAQILAKYDMIHFAGSDVHSLNPKPMLVEALVTQLTQLIGHQRVNEIISHNPQAIIKDSALAVREAKQYRQISAIKRLYNLLVSGL